MANLNSEVELSSQHLSSPEENAEDSLLFAHIQGTKQWLFEKNAPNNGAQILQLFSNSTSQHFQFIGDCLVHMSYAIHSA
jgi:hypothetical protein